MREISIVTFVTLDGVMQSPGSTDEDPSEGFRQGGWARDCWDEVMEQVAREAMAEPYDALFGRKTYELFSAHFPETGEAIEIVRLNEATKYVVTSSPANLSWKNSVRVAGATAIEDIKKLKQQNGKLLQIHGSWQLIQALLENDLVDELRLWTFPVIVGAGKKLFTTRAMPSKFSLVKTDHTPKGAVMAIYRKK